MSDGSSLIADQVDRFVDGRAWGRIRLIVDHELLLELAHFPVGDLADRLESWERMADEGPNCHGFFFGPPDGPRELLGAIRIEPRPAGWQFTAVHERKRGRLLELEEVKRIVRDFVDRVRAIERPQS